jgi:hypothetical protein
MSLTNFPEMSYATLPAVRKLGRNAEAESTPNGLTESANPALAKDLLDRSPSLGL